MIFALLFAGALASGMPARVQTPTPTGGTIGWTHMPDPIFDSCDEALDPNAPNWAGDYNYGLIRIEQCGNRIAILGAGVTHDFPAVDGTYANGLDDWGAGCVGLPVLPHLLHACRVVVKAVWDHSAQTCLQFYREEQAQHVHVVSWCDAGTHPNGMSMLTRTVHIDPLMSPVQMVRMGPVGAFDATPALIAGNQVHGAGMTEDGSTAILNKGPAVSEEAVPRVVVDLLAAIGLAGILYGVYAAGKRAKTSEYDVVETTFQVSCFQWYRTPTEISSHAK